MRAEALSTQECAWTLEECHLAEKMNVATQRDSLCLPNFFRARKVKSFTRTRTRPTNQIHFTARELLLELMDQRAIQELAKRAGVAKATAGRQSYSQGREQSTNLSEEQYADALTWLSIVLQSGLASGEDCGSGTDVGLHLNGWQNVLKKSSFQASLLSLSRLEDKDKMEALSAFYSHLTRRYQALYTPGQHLAVKKYCLSYQQTSSPLYLALLCDTSSGFICNMYLYSPEQLQKASKTPVVEQVVSQLLRPYHSRGYLVQLHNSAWMEGKLTELFSEWGVNIYFEASIKRPVVDNASCSSAPRLPCQHQWAPVLQEEPPSQLLAHFQGWTGPALFPKSNPSNPVVEIFLPGLWATLHIIYINTFVLHTLQNQESCKRTRLREFTRFLASQLAMENCVAVTNLSGPHTSSSPDTYVTTHTEQRSDLIVTDEFVCRLQGGRQPGVCGLVNSGNSCYLNAVLQCLCSTVPLVDYFLSKNTQQELAKRKRVVAGVFGRLLEEMWLGQKSSCAPLEMKFVVCSLQPQFDNDFQQDAQELLLFLLNALHDDLKEKGDMRQIHSLTWRLRQDKNRNYPCTTGGPTIISHLFEGQLSYVTICTDCGYQSYSTQDFTTLSLPIPPDIRDKCSLQDCISLFFRQSMLTGGNQMLCSECGTRRDTTILTSLVKPPEILMLHLKRFAYQGKKKVKLRTNVLFSLEELDLTPFLSCPSAQCSTYSLYAVVNHIGHLDMGHYTALCHNPLTRRWHWFDDATIREVQDYFIQSPNAYILLYSRKPFHSPQISGL
ncbi:ubiquitin carboxyl-terminal hydrolase 22-A-like [Lampris incognitus]|uniref:ubiquitin carboxyl-terminal hydrolase 22-A-like n=1 Tax=Lampris incognitus TaxID=2546036 RepID=UPI0024B4BF0D|nr:ubiquitin carboxyl-terminal hydrolase 22-A-like [Lampris incognitus]